MEPRAVLRAGIHRKLRNGYSLRDRDGSMPGSGATMHIWMTPDVYVTATRNTEFYPKATGVPGGGTADLMEPKRALYNESQAALLGYNDDLGL